MSVVVVCMGHFQKEIEEHKPKENRKSVRVEEGQKYHVKKAKQIEGKKGGCFTWFAVILVHDAIEDTVPASRGGHLEEEDHALPKRLEVVHFVQGSAQLHCHEETHAKNGKNEHHKEKEKANVEKSWHGHGQSKQ